MVFVLLLLSVSGLMAAGFDLMPALKKVEDRYNNVRTLEIDFTQTMSFLAQPTAKRTESGVLYLRKPGKMRWDYQQPSKKVFLSDGKDVYFYTPAANRMERSKLKETEDMRAPSPSSSDALTSIATSGNTVFARGTAAIGLSPNRSRTKRLTRRSSSCSSPIPASAASASWARMNPSWSSPSATNA